MNHWEPKVDIHQPTIAYDKVSKEFVSDTNSLFVELENKNLKCNVCGREMSFRNKWQDMRNHVETHIEGLSYPCHICDKKYRSKNLYI